MNLQRLFLGILYYLIIQGVLILVFHLHSNQAWMIALVVTIAADIRGLIMRKLKLE